MSSLWLSYIPRHVVEDMLAYSVEHERRFDAVALFADVSGFTVISEALGKTGRAGTEELTTLLNSYFQPMIELIRSYGGVVGKFGGDAMTVLFPYEASNQLEIVRRAIQCALEMQENMHRYEALQTSAGEFGLAMKAGLAMGTVLTTNVGQPDIRLEYIIAGELLDLCADAEHHATKGEVVLHDPLLEFAGDIEIIERREGFTRVGALKQSVSKVVLPELPDLPEQINSLLASYLHPRIAELVRGGHSEFINEHRRVTILFVSFSGFDYDHDPEVGTKLKNYLGAVIHTVNRYDGYVNKIDMGDKGSKYIILFGTPVTHENDDERALRCALDLSRIPNVPVRIGVNTGFVYCGQVGSNIRQEYTVMGDSVNLSARLMQYAKPGEIVVSGFTNRLQENSFSFENRDPITVKGKTEPIPIRILRDVIHATAMEVAVVGVQLPMVGRQDELTIAEENISDVLQNDGRILGVTAEAGMGKSRLSSEIVKLAKNHQMGIHIGECLSYGTNISYLVWQNIWRSFFSINPSKPDREQIEHLRDELHQINPLLVQRLPLLGPVLNIAIPDNELTEELEPKLRQDLLSSLLLDCLRWYSDKKPLLLVVEDSHWIDSLSQQLLEFIGRNIRDLPVMILMVYRPPLGDQEAFNPIKQFAHFTELVLQDFTEQEARQLVALKLRQLFRYSGVIVDGLMDRITERAQGNPFYIDELINLIHGRGIDPRDVEALENLELPDSLHSLIVSRIDHLAEQDQLTLKVASVIGRLFRASWLWGSYPDVGTPEAIHAQLKRLYALEIVSEDNPEPELEYLFKHVLTQEVAYESLAYSTRETLHESIGAFIERTYVDNLSSMVSLLAHHYGHSRNTDKQRVYFRRAADTARSVYDNRAAITYYRRLLPLLDDRIEVLLNLGEVLQLIGEWAEAEAIYREAMNLAGEGTVLQARCQTLIGNLMLFTQSPVDAETWLENARTTLENLDEDDILKQTLKFLAIVYWQQGKLDDALKTSFQQLMLAIRTNDSIAMSDAHLNLANGYLDQGNFVKALDYFQQSLDGASEMGHRYGVVAANSDLAGLYFFQGDYVQSIERLQTAFAIAQEIGFLQGAGQIITNMGEIYRSEENYEDAALCYQYALDLMNSIGDMVNAILVLGNTAIVYGVQQFYDQAEQLYSYVISLARRLDIPSSLSEYLYHLAELRYKQKAYNEALLLNTEALSIATEISLREFQFQTQVLDIQIKQAAGQITVGEGVAQFEAQLDEWEEPPNQAALHYHIWKIDATQVDIHAQAVVLYRELYDSLPNVLHYQRLKELTNDDTLTPPPTLPTLPPSIKRNTLSFEEILEIAETFNQMN